jgi:thiol-disulfide isomerase/thioredoxin
MNRPIIALLAFCACLSGLAIGIVAARKGHMATVKAASVAHAPATSFAKPRKPSGATDDADGGDGARVIRFASNGQPAPPFLVQDLDGNVVSTAAWQGKVVLLNFWATWCPPCREEIPVLIELSKQYPEQLLVVGVSMDDGPTDEVKDFASAEGINYPIVMWSRELVKAYGGVPALPTSFLIDKQGHVVQKHVGLFPGGVYEIEVRALLGLPVDATIETFEDTGQIFLKNASRATELPDVDFTGLTPAQRKLALKRLNSEFCNCGCTLTLAQCRMNDTACPVSKALAAKIVKEILAGSHASSASSAPSRPASN